MKQNRIISICLVVCIIASLFSGVVVDTKVDAKTKAIALNKTKVSLYEGGKIRLKLKNCKKKVVWSSSNKKVAVVSSKGKVIAKKKGTAWIIAKSNKKTYKCKVNVKKKVNKKTTAIPSIVPTEEPTMSPTEEPSISPIEETTKSPTEKPTVSSTEEPISVPTEKPTATPTITPEDDKNEHWHNYVETEKRFYNYEDDSPCEEITNSATQYGYIKEECTECGDTEIRYIACPDYRKMFGEEKVDHISIGKEYQIHIKTMISECDMKDLQFSFGRNLDGKEYFDGVILTTDGKIKLTQDYDGGFHSSIPICYSFVLETSNKKQSGSLWLDTDIVSTLSDLSNPSQKKEMVRKKAEKVIKEIINENMTDAEKVHAVFKWICDNTYYDFESAFISDESLQELIGTDALASFTEYGVAINGKAVCDGYAFMFKYFMDSLGIENHYVYSSLPNHAWNQVKINDEWYWVDCTWADPYGENVKNKYDYECFLQSGQRVYEGFVMDEHNGTVCDGTHRKEILESLGIDFDTTVQDDDSLIELIFDDSGTKVVGFTPSNNKKAVVPSSVLVIAPNAFYECFDMKSLVISEGVQVIDIAACLHCRQLEEVVLPESLTEIRMQAFAGCRSLKKVIIPSKITKIEEGTFEGCYNLESIILPEGLISIEDYAFSSCGLKSIVIPDNVTEIGDYAFHTNRNLEEIILPKDLKTIGSGAFANCKKLKKLVLPDGITSISEDVFLDPIQGEITSEPEIVWRGVSYKNSQDFFEAFNQVN